MRIATAAILSLALLAPAPATADDAGLFGYFRSICGSVPDPAAAVARAAEQGFAPAKTTPKVGDLKEVKAFEKTVGGREFFVITGRGVGKPRDGRRGHLDGPAIDREADGHDSISPINRCNWVATASPRYAALPRTSSIGASGARSAASIAGGATPSGCPARRASRRGRRRATGAQAPTAMRAAATRPSATSTTQADITIEMTR